VSGRRGPQEVIDAIAAEGNDNAHPAGGGAPNKDVTIEEVTIG
jgi:peptidyl-prolyl cis-trans isomerase B (cyclophilin B)